MNKQFKHYPKYKDSGVEWLGDIPSGWSITSLGSILELKSDKNNPSYDVLSVYREHGVIPKDSRDDNHNVTSLDLSNYKAVNPGDFVVNKMKAWQGSMGVSKYKGIVSPAYITCNINKQKIDCDFLHKLLRSDIYIGEYNKLSYGVRVGQWDMHYEDFKKIYTIIPPTEEQKRIAEFLDKKTAQIDQAHAQKQQMIELLKERRKIITHNAVTRGLNPDAPMKPSGIDWLGSIPAHWQIKKLKYLGNIFAGITGKAGEDFAKEQLTDRHKPFIPFTNICNNNVININQYQYVKIKEIENQNTIINGDLLFLMSSETLNDIGKCSLYLGNNEELYLNSFCKGFRLGVYDTSPSFVNLLFQSQSYRGYFSLVGRGFTRINIKQEYINDLPVLLPPINEQKQIVEYLDNITTKIEAAITCKQNEIEKLKEYKATLINSAVTGKIKV